MNKKTANSPRYMQLYIIFYRLSCILEFILYNEFEEDLLLIMQHLIDFLPSTSYYYLLLLQYIYIYIYICVCVCVCDYRCILIDIWKYYEQVYEINYSLYIRMDDDYNSTHKYSQIISCKSNLSGELRKRKGVAQKGN